MLGKKKGCWCPAWLLKVTLLLNIFFKYANKQLVYDFMSDKQKYRQTIKHMNRFVRTA